MRRAHPLAANPERAILAEALTAAVCHGTNWDQLNAGIIRYLRDDRVSPNNLNEMSYDEFAQAFGDAFSSLSDSSNPDNELQTRFRMFTATAASYRRNRFGIRVDSERNTLLREGGLFSYLGRVTGFCDDPEGKKMRIFAQSLIRYSLASFRDADDLPPAVEYHILRLYLRTGRVVPETISARRSVSDFAVRRVDSVTELRRAVAEAMRITAIAAEMRLLDLNDVEWQIARSFCVREEPRCDGPPLATKPIASSIPDPDGGCPLRDMCAAALGIVPKSWTEPRLASRHRTFY